MPEVEIRPAVPADFAALEKFDPSYQSTHVWQMDRLIEDGQVVINFRQTRLPRPVRVEYVSSRPLFCQENWSHYQAILVATVDQAPVGYIGLSDQFAPKTLWVIECAVHEDLRRKGIGTALVLAAQEWALEHNYRKMVLEMQSKNHPAVQMANKLGYEFCGYNDHYFPNQDIALFFSRFLR